MWGERGSRNILILGGSLQTGGQDVGSFQVWGSQLKGWGGDSPLWPSFTPLLLRPLCQLRPPLARAPALPVLQLHHHHQGVPLAPVQSAPLGGLQSALAEPPHLPPAHVSALPPHSFLGTFGVWRKHLAAGPSRVGWPTLSQPRALDGPQASHSAALHWGAGFGGVLGLSREPDGLRSPQGCLQDCLPPGGEAGPPEAPQVLPGLLREPWGLRP